MTHYMTMNRLVGKGYRLEVQYSDVINACNENGRPRDGYGIRRAYEYADGKHAGVLRGSGEPYIKHCLRVARSLAEWGFESEVIIASFLHDVVEDCDTPLTEIAELFGTNVAGIVDVVTALSDQDFTGQKPTKAQRDDLSDARLQKLMDDKALFVKIADRIDNLNTLWGVPEEKRIPKAEHTRDILIPIVILARAFFFVDVLEELCFEIEHPGEFAEIRRLYETLRRMNSRKCRAALDALRAVFKPDYVYENDEMERYRRYILNFESHNRTPISIYRQITADAENIRRDLRPLLCKSNIAQYDLYLTVDSSLAEPESTLSPNDLFMRFYEEELSRKGFYIVDYRRTTHGDSSYFLLADEMDNLYRLFVRTEKEFRRYLYGSVIDDDKAFSITDVNDIMPRETYNEKIKVFRRDGSAMMIDKNATVLDFAFYIHSDLGLHFRYAMVNDTATQLPPYTRLNDGDTVVIVEDWDAAPELAWFKYVRTIRATDQLVRYFTKLCGPAPSCVRT